MRKIQLGSGTARETSSSPSFSPPTFLVGKESPKFPVIPVSPEDDGSQQESGLNVGVFSLQGKRPYQEDEYGIRQFLGANCMANPDPKNRALATHFFGLFDGHAGGRCSKHISAALPEVLVEDSLFLSNLPLALKRSFHTANDVFLKIAEQQRLHDGSTGICSLIRNGKLLVGNVGDCRALLLSAGKPIQMSIDQKPTNPDEIKRIASLGGTITNNLGVARVNGVLAVSRAFGNRKLRKVIRPDIEMMQRDLTREDDFLVMASDGLWDVLRNKDVCDICYSLASSQRVQQIAEELVHAALARGSMDNVTCIVVKLAGYVAKSFMKDTCDIRLETNNGTLADRGNARSPAGGLRCVTPSKAQSPLTLSTAPEGGPNPTLQRSLFPRGSGTNVRDTDSPENGLNGRQFNTNSSNNLHNQRFPINNTANSSKMASYAAALTSSRFELPYNASHAAHPSYSRGTGKTNYASSGDFKNPPGLWGTSGTVGDSGKETRPWTVSAPMLVQVHSAMLQGRQSPNSQSIPVLFDRTQQQQQQGNQVQLNQQINGNTRPRSREGDTQMNTGDRGDIDIEDPHAVLMRPNPQPATGFSKSLPMSVSSRFQQSGGSFKGMPNHDPRSGFVPPKETQGQRDGQRDVQREGQRGSIGSAQGSRASSASAASVRHNQSMNAMPKLHTKAASSDSFYGQRFGTDSPVFTPENTFSSIAATSLPSPTAGGGGGGGGGTGSAGNSPVAGGGMRPLNSPIAFLTAAAERQRSVSTGQRAGMRQGQAMGGTGGVSGERNRLVSSNSNRKVSQMRIAYA